MLKTHWLTTLTLVLSTASCLVCAAPASCDLASIEKDINAVISSVIQYDNEQGEAMMIKVDKLIKEGKVAKEQAGMFMLGMMGDASFMQQMQERINRADTSMKKLAAMKEAKQPDCATAEQIKTDIAYMKEISRQQWASINRRIDTELVPAAAKP